MKTINTLLLICSSWLAFGQQTTETITIGSETREYIQYLPTGFDASTESVSVVFCLHGLGDNMTNMSGIGFNYIADTARIIVIYPQGLNSALGQSSWNNNTQFVSSTANDLGLFNAIIDDLVLNKNADPTKIYSTGFSMGGIMSHTLACALNDRIAAIATMSGTMSTYDIANCNAVYKTPVIHFHGTADGTVPYDSGALPSLSLVAETIDFWRGVHGCDAAADSTQIADNANDGYTTDRFVYQNCTPDASVELWRINGADHEYMYQPNNDFTEAIEAWNFFNKWSHSNPASASISTQELQRLQISPNPSNGLMNISSEVNTTLLVFNNLGQNITTIELKIGENTVDLGALPIGSYILKNEQFVGRINIVK